MIIRGFAALVISAVLGIGTLVVVNNASNDANDTAKEITRQSLEYQKEALKDADPQTKAAQDSIDTQIDEATKQSGADVEAIQENVEEQTKAVQDDVQEQIDAATKQIEEATK
jgi:gas vesicle protein